MEGSPVTRRLTARLPAWTSVRIDCPRLTLRKRSCLPAQPPSLGAGVSRICSTTVQPSLPFLMVHAESTPATTELPPDWTQLRGSSNILESPESVLTTRQDKLSNPG